MSRLTAELSDLARLVDPEFYVGDPHPVYERLRVEAPVWWCEQGGFWAITKHADITAIAADPGLWSSAHGSFLTDVKHHAKRKVRNVSRSKLSFGSDPPEFTRYRRLVSSAFTPRIVDSMEPMVRRLVKEAIAQVEPGEVVNFVDTVAVPTSINVIAELLGVPRADWADFKRWSDAVVDFVDVEPGSEEEERVHGELGELAAYLLDQLTHRRAEPKDDLMSSIAHLELDGEPTTPDLQLSFAQALLAAGNETTRNTLSGGVIALAQHPDQLRLLGEEPELSSKATEEILRWTSVIHAFVRRATADTTIRDQEIAGGDYVGLMFPAANRDEDAWTDAGTFDIRRDGGAPQLAFSWGPHRCLGAHLARLEITIAFEELTRTYPRWEIAGDIVQHPSTVVDAYDDVPIRFLS